MKSHLYALIALLCTHSVVAAELDRCGGDKAMKTDDGNAAPICGSDLGSVLKPQIVSKIQLYPLGI